MFQDRGVSRSYDYKVKEEWTRSVNRRLRLLTICFYCDRYHDVIWVSRCAKYFIKRDVRYPQKSVEPTKDVVFSSLTLFCVGEL